MLEGHAHKVLQWYLCRTEGQEGWFATNSDNISLICWDEKVLFVYLTTLIFRLLYKRCNLLLMTSHKLKRVAPTVILRNSAGECKSVLDAVESIFQQGTVDVQVDTRLQETVSRAVELLPELWKQAICHDEAISTYRRALLSQWNLDNDCCARIQKRFVVFLLYSGVEAGPPSLSIQVEGSYMPKNNLEEAIVLLMILLWKYNLGKTKWDPLVMEHLTFALTLCNQTSVIATPPLLEHEEHQTLMCQLA